ncbi:acyltransferase family protein [Aeromicrobium stalagmiti]|uniref:acyltransferase family protein n=1 Tax=Aeromicrobium stalagmiti TaxID=2738988 RepID=UPI00156A215E|nr:acyltransferase family protein [Aeromicrobium stalagmiti]NRQ48675.1 acyltransferase [Aeromicrobium stalagmiti]
MTMVQEQRRALGESVATPRAQHAQRDDIQGLRALAVLVVVAYHAGLPFVPGGFVGVDLFFVLSGFLITQLLLREITATGTVSLREFWARRARRILPVSVLVLITTMIASRVLMSPLERPAIGTDVLWSALFSGNWRFAQQQTDYLAADRDPSPVLHYWSLGVEEQFYLVWPVLLIVLAVVWRLSGRRPRAYAVVFGGAFVAVILVSLAWCVRTTATDQPYAFFGTPARAWQLAAGALTALAVPVLVRLLPRTRVVLATAGIAGFALCVAALDEAGVAGLTYPSWLAVAPTAAGVLLVAAGTGGSTPLGRLLSVRPLTYVGDISFSLYLWHWPVLVIGMAAIGAETPDVRIALVVLALGLSVVSHHLVENPLRRARVLARRPALSLAFGVALVAAVLPVASYASATGTIDRVTVAPVAQGGTPTATPATPETITPALEDAAGDEGPFKASGCHVGFSQETTPSWDGCTFADRGGSREVVVLGDSIAGAVGPAVVRAGEQHGWAVTVWAKSSCPMADVTRFDAARGGAYLACDAFREAALREIEQRHPDVVVLAMSRLTTERVTVDGEMAGGRESVVLATEGMERTVDRLHAAGIGVVLSDSPNRAPFFPTDCLAETRDARQCTFHVNGKTSIMAATSDAMGDDVVLVEPNEAVCPDGTCQPVVDNVVVYRDKVHFTQTFARTLADRFTAGVDAALR